MYELSPALPVVSSVGGFGAITTIPGGPIPGERPIDPTSPTTLKHSNSTSSSHSSSSSGGSGSSRRTSSRHKERPDSTYVGLSSRDLARMLVEEEIRTTHFSELAQTLSSQLSQQKQRTDDAERRATNAAVRLKEETEVRVRAEQALKQKAEELKLYQAQLKRAQGEIYRAQDALAEVEKMRDEAEHAAAKARSIARKLREQRLVDIAREEGRRVGLREGLARGQEIDYVDRGYAYLEGGAAVEEVDDDDYYSPTTRSRNSPLPRTATTTAPPSAYGRGGGGRAPGITDPPEERVLNPITVTSPMRVPSPEPSPPRHSQPVPVPTPEPAIPSRSPSIANVGTRTPHKQTPVPPDSWIPRSDGDTIRLPPPHEFSPHLSYPTTLPPQPQVPGSASPTPPLVNPPTAKSPPVKSSNNRPILVVPPPASDTNRSDRDSTTSGPYSPVVDRRESHHRRRRSSDSQTSTTISQMDILDPPISGRDRERMSSIPEERASAMSSAMSSAMASPNNTPSVRSFQSNSNFLQSNAAAAYTPSLRSPSINIEPAPSLHKTASMSSEEYQFDVVPPSRPTSNTFDETNLGVTTSQQGMLSAEDAHNRPLPSVETPRAPSPPVVAEPPLGFIPFNSSPAQNRSPLPANPAPLSPAAGWGYNFQNLPSTHVEEPPTAPVIPSALSSKSRKALSDMSGVSSSTKYTTPNQNVNHTPTTGNRNKRVPSVTSSDDEVSSNLSSDSSLSTPPVQARRALTPIYGPVSLPPAVPGTGRTAPMSLPPQTPGTGRMNPVNLPPSQPPQQSQNPDGLPPPGAVNESLTPATTTGSMRGRGTGNRGKKRR